MMFVDLIKYDSPSMGQRIQFMLQQLEFKLAVEKQYKEANEKISRLYQIDGDRQSSFAARGGMIESNQKIQLLKKALRRYQDVHINLDDIDKESNDFGTLKGRRRPLSGTFSLTIHRVNEVDHVASPMFSRSPESLIIIRIDDQEKNKTKPTRSDRWNEEFNFPIEKGNEVELTVYDKIGDQLVPVAVTWISLSDLTEVIRKQKVRQDLSSGWVSADRMNQHSNTGEGNSQGSQGIGQAVGEQGGHHHQDGPQGPVADRAYNQVWFVLEPAGKIQLSMGFTKSIAPEKRRKEGGLGGLDRHGAIRMKNEEVFEQHGHRFAQKQFYNIMCCALCGDFLRYTGFQCIDCRFVCHKKCYQKVVTKCIARSSSDIDPDEEKLKHRIPHRFEPYNNRGTNWCCHCGYLLPWGKKNVRRCTECTVMCHADCAHLVPDFCGMDMQRANEILSTIKSAKGKQPPVRTHEPKASITQQNIGQPEGRPQYQESPYQSPSQPPAPRQQYPGQFSQQIPNADIPDKKLPTTPGPAQVIEPIKQYPQTRRPPPLSSYNNSAENSPYQQSEQSPVSVYSPQSPRKSYQSSSPSQSQYPSTSGGAAELPIISPVGGSDADFEYKQQVSEPKRPDSLKLAPEPQQPAPDTTKLTPQTSPVAVTHPASSPSHHHSRSKRPHKRKVGLDDFQFLAVLGKGNFGKVMLAESRHNKNLYAIKVLKKDFIIENDEVGSTKSEKRVFLIANQEHHPFLINLSCCFQTENRIYFVMEYIAGGDLMWHIQKERFSPRRAQYYAAEVLLALKYFHANGVIYRDLKLDNIMLSPTGHVKIADYGLCKEEMWYGNTTGTFCGTPEFMAPEILKEQGYGKAVDWWAYSVLLYQMLLGQSPFRGEDEDEIFDAILSDEPLYPIHMQRDSVSILQALLTRDPERRVGSGPKDADEIMEHPYFRNVNFDEMLNLKVPPPYVPQIKDGNDISHFDQEFTTETPKLTPVTTTLTADMQEKFRGFSYLNDDGV